ncbi:MAG: SpoIIE family protein phosphatase [Salinivirgaceae bacterium]|nr:SpoIIE family protein phosphatase [Salinivirgaceae bacterium]
MQRETFLSIILFFFILLTQQSSFAQDTIFLDNESRFNIAKNTLVFKDSVGDKSIRDVVYNVESKDFTKNVGDIIEFMAEEKTNWITFIIKNDCQIQKTFYLELRNSQIKNIQFFSNKNSLIISNLAQETNLPLNKRILHSRFITEQIVLDANESVTCYFKIANNNQLLKIPIIIYDESSFISNILRDSILNGIYYGILLTILIASIALIIMRINTKVLFYFLIYLFFSIFYFFNIDGYGFQYLYANSPWITENLIFIIPNLIYISLTLLVIRILVETCKKNNKYCFALFIWIAIGVIVFITQLIFNFNYNISTRIYITYAFASWLLLLIFIVKSFKLTPIGKPLFVAHLFHLIVLVTFIIHFSKFHISFFQLEKFCRICTVIHFSIILFAIIRQIGLYHLLIFKKSEQNHVKLQQLKEKMNIELENTVRERTKKLQETNRELNSLVTHNKKITDELHNQREEVDKTNRELELAFKRSSAQHIKLQKAMMLNMEQQKKLADSIEIIQVKNNKLENQNEEILSQQDKIRDQNVLLEERSRNITDSIVYAERIQNSFFPPESKIQELFPEQFIYFRPKDILSGDIYWVDKIMANESEKQLITAIDCTGHGVPGALMSIIARDAINEAIHHNGLTDTGTIVNCINDIVIHTLNKEGNINHIKDGMDLSMVIVDYATQTLQFTGAKNPLYLIRNNELIITKGHILSVGTIENNSSIVDFPTHTIPFHKGDIIYLFSDGYADQFGGENGNKFRYSRFRELLLNINKLTPNDQYLKLDNTFVNWKGEWEQVDDVLIIGVKL